MYSRKPVVVLPRTSVREDSERASSVHEDELDQHVEEVLTKRAKIRRTLRGVWSFIKTRMHNFFKDKRATLLMPSV